MSDPVAQAASALVLRVSVPLALDYHEVVRQLAARVAAYLGDPEPDAQTAVRAVEDVTQKVAPEGQAESGEDITVEFRQRENELLIVARCDGRSSHVRHALPA